MAPASRCLEIRVSADESADSASARLYETVDVLRRGISACRTSSGTPRSFFRRSNTCGRNELTWRRACPSSEFVFADCAMVSVAISNNAMISSKNWVSLEGIQRSLSYIVRFVMKKRSGIGEGTLDKGAQEPIERSISDNRDDIHVRNRLNVSSIRLS